MIKAVVSFVIIAFALVSILNVFNSAVELENTLELTGAAQITGIFSVKSAVRGITESVLDAFDHLSFRCTLNLKYEFKVLTAGV